MKKLHFNKETGLMHDAKGEPNHFARPETQNTDKATARPWHLNYLETIKVSIHAARGHVADVSCSGTMGEVELDEAEANASLIVQAVNEHAALVVAEGQLRTLINLHTGITDGGEGITPQDWQNAHVSLLNLADVRKDGAK